MGGYTTPKLSSRNQEINSRDRGRGGARVFCSSSCLAGSFGFGGATVPSFLSRDAAVICHVVGGERLRCICNFTRHSPPPSPSPSVSSRSLSHRKYPASLPFLSPSPSVPLRPLPTLLRFRKRATTRHGIREVLERREREREGRERRRQTVAKLLGAADDCLRFVPTSPAAPPRICPVK